MEQDVTPAAAAPDIEPAALWQRITLLDRLAELSRTRPDVVPVTMVNDRGDDATRLTYPELSAAARRVARYLIHERGLRAGVTVLLVYPPSMDFVTALLGCMMAGVVPVPVAPPNPLRPEHAHRELVAVAERSGAKAILTNGQYLMGIRVGGLRGVLTGTHRRRPGNLPWWRTDRVSADDTQPTHRARPGDVAFLQYTSGSTSSPKGVVITHANIVHQLWLNHQELGLGAHSVAVTWVPHFHDFGLISGLLSAIFGNGRLYMLSPLAFLKNPAVWFDVMSRVRATHTAAPDFAYRLAVRRSNDAQRANWALSTLRVVMSAAEPVRWRTQDDFSAAFRVAGLDSTALCPSYGLAEHTVGVTVGGRKRLCVERLPLELSGEVKPLDWSADGIRLVGCGPPSQGVDLRIVDPESHTALPEGRVGEIWVDSPSKAVGYWDEPDLSDARFHARLPGGAPDGYLRTGDLGFLWQGELFITGRLKDLIILNGRNLHPQDLEETVAEVSPLIRKGRVAAFSVPTEGSQIGDAGEGLAVVVELADKRPKPETLDVLVEQVRERLLADHRVACQVLVLGRPGAIQKTTSGKLRRQAMRQAHLDGELEARAHRVVTLEPVSVNAVEPIGGESPPVFVPETSLPLETWMIREVASALGVPEASVSPAASLQAMGADSLLVVGLSAAIAERWGVEIGADVMAANPTLAHLVQTVHAAVQAPVAAESSSDASSAEREHIDQPLPLTPAQGWVVETVGHRIPNHWNLPVILSSDSPLDPTVLRAALAKLAERHPALRLRLTPAGEDVSAWRQRFEAVSAPPVRVVDLSALRDPEIIQAVERDVHATQSTLDLVAGPVWRAVVYRTGPGRPDRLLLLFHHFVIDGFSTRLLLREFEALYLACEGGQPTPQRFLPQRYGDWVRGLTAEARSPAMRSELAYWRTVLAGRFAELPYDHPRDENPEGLARALSFELAPASSAALLGRIAGDSDIGLEAVMLHALEQTFVRWGGMETPPLIDVQRHGRTIDPAGVRAERIVGWTNDVFPVHLPLPQSGSVCLRTRTIQQRLDDVPNLGRGYGLLRYLGTDADRAVLGALPVARVKLLCHSRLMASARSQSLRFRLSDESPGLSYGADLRARYALLIYASVHGERLRMDLTYGSGLFEAATAEAFMAELEAALERLAVAD